MDSIMQRDSAFGIDPAASIAPSGRSGDSRAAST